MSDYVHRVHTVYIEMSKYFCIPVQFCIVQPAQFSTLLWIFHLTFSKYLACNSQNCGHSSFSYVYIVHPEIGCILMCTWASQSTVLVCSLCWSHNFLHWKKGQERDQCFRCSMSRCRAYSHFPSPDLHVFTSSLHRSYEYTVVYL